MKTTDLIKQLETRLEELEFLFNFPEAILSERKLLDEVSDLRAQLAYLYLEEDFKAGNDMWEVENEIY